MNNHCKSMIPSPPPCHEGNHHHPSSPFLNDVHNVCTGCCSHMHPTMLVDDAYPSAGKMVENAFMLVNSTPYLYDNTHVQYGQRLSVSENVITKVSQRRDPSCINLAATFDMTNDILTNTTLNHFLEQIISDNYDTLMSILPVLVSDTFFKISYTIRDSLGAVVHTSIGTVTSQEMKVHQTDINDYFVNSCKNLFVANIPAMDYQGEYTITLDAIHAYVNVLDTQIHITDDLNPFYQFTNNNTKIAVQHDTIMQQTQFDTAVLIASCDINQSFHFKANVTTRLRLSFTAYMSNLISTENTFNVWSSLYQPTEEMIRDLKAEVLLLNETLANQATNILELSDALTLLKEEVYTMKNTIPVVKYDKNTQYITGQIVWLVPGEIYQSTKDFTSKGDDGITVEEAFLSDISEGNIVLITPTVTPEEFPDTGDPEEPSDDGEEDTTPPTTDDGETDGEDTSNTEEPTYPGTEDSGT